MLRQPVRQSLFGEWIGQSVLHHGSRLPQARDESTLLEGVITNHVFARVKFNQQAIESFTGIDAGPLPVFMPQDEKADWSKKARWSRRNKCSPYFRKSIFFNVSRMGNFPPDYSFVVRSAPSRPSATAAGFM